MRKRSIALFVLTIVSSAMIAGCSNKTNDNSVLSQTSEESAATTSGSETTDTYNSENADVGETTDGDFVWEDGKYIKDLSEEGVKKKEIVIPENCQMFMMSDFQSGNFSGNDNLESIIFESEHIEDLPAACFWGDVNLKKVELPKNLKRISENLFTDCSSLESVEIPNSVTEIEAQAFEGTAIKELKIPESVTTVGETVFRFTKIEKLYLPESLTSISSSFLGDLDDLDDSSYKLTVYVKKGSYADKHFDDYKKEVTTKEYY